METETWLSLLVFILPAYVANAAPVIFGGGVPIDFRLNWPDGRRIFGDSKTLRGFFVGVFAGAVTGFVIAQLTGDTTFKLMGLFLGTGAMLGDLAGSFVKRRLNFKPGHPSFLLDQLPFLYSAIIFAQPFFFPSIIGIAFLTVLTIVMHSATNFGAAKLGLKRVPW